MDSFRRVSRSDKVSFKVHSAILRQNFIGKAIKYGSHGRLFSGVVVWETKGTFHIVPKDSKLLKVIKKAGSIFEIACPKELISTGVGPRIVIDGRYLLGSPVDRVSRSV